jgi:ABC-2 type transport system ATP-binding protein
VDVLDDGVTVSVHVPDSGRSLQRVVRLLNENRVTSEKVGIREPTLDDVFIQLTGRPAEPTLEDEAPEGRGAA